MTWKADCRETKNVSARDGCDIPPAAAQEIRYFRYQHSKEVAAATLCKCPRNELAEKEVVTAMKVMANEKIEGPKGLPVELRNSDFNKIGPSYSSFTDVPPMSDAREKFHTVAKTPSLPYFARTATIRRAETSAASLPFHTRVMCSFKWLPVDLAITVRPRYCHQRSRTGFDWIALPQALRLWCAKCRDFGGRQKCHSSCAPLIS